MRRASLLGAVLAVLAPLWVGTAGPAVAESLKSCDGVWVVVDAGSLGGVTTECATDFGTGTAALKSAGFAPTLESGMITKIAGKPETPDISKSYWSYWHATRKADGSFGDWAYSDLGANSYHPAKGNAEGWRYQSLADGKVAPDATPPSGPTPTEKPSESAKPPATPTAKPTAKPTATKTVTKSPTATATATATATVTKTPTKSPRATATATATATAEPTTPSATTSESGEPTSWPSSTGTPPPGAINSPGAPSSSGAPVGALVAGGLVVAGAAGLGGWWWLKGRHR
ncbi:MAG TPA: hypothetical protein PKV13_08530 [Propionicimonas sp.]|nr:hypothetical protein [Propionicimonas sp.]